MDVEFAGAIGGDAESSRRWRRRTEVLHTFRLCTRKGSFR